MTTEGSRLAALRDAIDRFQLADADAHHPLADQRDYELRDAAVLLIRDALDAGLGPLPDGPWVRCPVCAGIEHTDDVVGGVCLTCSDAITFAHNERRATKIVVAANPAPCNHRWVTADGPTHCDKCGRESGATNPAPMDVEPHVHDDYCALAASFWMHYRCGYVDCRIVEQHEHGGGQPTRQMTPQEIVLRDADGEPTGG